MSLASLFSMHAEFQLNTPPYHPFWYTPGQFQGRLIIRDDGSELTYFQMHVPNEKKLNVGNYSFSLPVHCHTCPLISFRYGMVD
jgi:hypothetical protein